MSPWIALSISFYYRFILKSSVLEWHLTWLPRIKGILHFDFEYCSINDNEPISLIAITSERIVEMTKKKNIPLNSLIAQFFFLCKACLNDRLQIAAFSLMCKDKKTRKNKFRFFSSLLGNYRAVSEVKHKTISVIYFVDIFDGIFAWIVQLVSLSSVNPSLLLSKDCRKNMKFQCFHFCSLQCHKSVKMYRNVVYLLSFNHIFIMIQMLTCKNYF